MKIKILLVRLSSMGDLIHTLPAVSDLAAAYPDVELHWLCEAGFADIAKLHPFVKKIHVMKWRYWRKHLTQKAVWQEIGRLKNDLQAEQFDFVLDSQGLVKSAAFAKMAAAPVKGLDWQSAREPLASLLYQNKFAVEVGRNAVWRNRKLFAQVFDYAVPETLTFGLRVPPCEHISADKPYYVFLHATSAERKLWPVEYWRELLADLTHHQDCAVYLPWGNESERQRAQEIAAGFAKAAVCDKMNLIEAAQLLKGAQGVAGVDTGLLHLANALDCPLVGIYTDTDPHKTGIQPSAWAKNLGNIGSVPSVQEVYAGLAACVAAKEAV
nr:lipopolysaccharide heptosyltransferase I [Neisseria lisongii]